MKEKTSSLKKVESDRPSVCTCSGCQCTSAPWNLRAMAQKEATVQDVYAVYKMHVISQNSRREASAEDEGSNVLYCMHSTLQFMVRSKKKMHRAVKVQISTSESGLNISAGNGPRWRFRA